MPVINGASNGADNTYKNVLPLVEDGNVSREYYAGFFNRLVFQWITPLMTAGYRKPLQEGDVWTISHDRKVGRHSSHLEDAFNRRVKEGSSDPLLWALHEVFKRDFWLAGVALFFGQMCQILAPLTVRYLINFVAAEHSPSAAMNSGIWTGVFFSIVLLLIQIGMTFGFCHGIYNGTIVGGEMRATLISSIFKKSLKLPSATSLKEKPMDNDRVLNPINLVGTDTQAIQDVMMLFHMIWTGPAAIVLALVILFINLTYSALGGLALMVLGALTINKVSAFFSARSSEIATARDARAGLLEEVLHAVRWVKLNTLEKRFLSGIKAHRGKEIGSMERSLAVRNVFTVLASALPAFGAMLSFIIFALTGHTLAAAEVFSSLAIYNCLRMPLQQLPFLVRMVASARVSARRIESFFLVEEPKFTAIYDSDMDCAVKADQVIFAWHHEASVEGDSNEESDEMSRLLSSDDQPSQARFRLENVTLRVPSGSLVTIVGGVASGKSSLLAGLAGEMPQMGGSLAFRHTRAYCSQSAWIMTGSIKDNIIFGRPVKQDFYQKVIAACALEADLKTFVNGDQTQVGERGVTLSGGQKQRISLARAIYSNCDVVLLDDPLSAVDADVGRHIQQEAILGLLKDKCIIIATHQYDLLPRSDQVIWLEDGRIKAKGSFQSLQADSPEFKTMTSAVKTASDQQAADLQRDSEEGKKQSDEEAPDHPEEPVVSQIVKEDAPMGIVSSKVYTSYLGASGWYIPWLVVTILVLAAPAMGVFTTVWLSWWTSGVFDLSMGAYIGIYIALVVVQYVVVYVSDVVAYTCGLNTSSAIFEKTLSNVMSAPVSFFNAVPIGRLLGVFTSDIDALDNQVPSAMKGFLGLAAVLISTLVMIAIYMPPFALAFPPVLILIYFGIRYFRASAREMTRYAAQYRGTAMATTHEAITGSSTIRAYGAQSRFTHLVDTSIDRMNSASYLNLANGPWLSVRGDMIGNLLIFLTSILVTVSKDKISPAVAGLLLTQVITIAQPLPYLVQAAANLEDSMISVERLNHYAETPGEEQPSPEQQASSLPASPTIQFEDVTLHYRHDLPPVLQNVNLTIPAGTRVAIVGRTGSGKSTLLSALTRLTPISSGTISLSSTPITSVPLSNLRSTIKTIPQDPAIFSGTIRSNLDPDSIYPDTVLLETLSKVGLTSTNDSHLPLPLDTPLPAHGSSLSQGQKQLLSLSSILPPRATRGSEPRRGSDPKEVPGPEILLLDEPTSSLPPNLDSQIHSLIHSSPNWKGKTVIMILHRLNTLFTKGVGVDMVVVMDSGRVVEVGPPKELWDKEEGGGRFRGLCDAAGIMGSDVEGSV